MTVATASQPRVVRRGVDAVAQVDTAEDWRRLCGRPGHHNIARTETVKFIVDLREGNRTYFLNSSRWVTHYDFILRFINPNADYQLFLVAEYKREDRRFLLGSVMHYLDGDHWTLELDAGDTLAGERIAWMYRHVAPLLGCAGDLRFRPVSPGQINAIEPLSGALPSLSRDAINASVQYQPLVLGVAYGYLRLLPWPLDVAALRPYDIVVTDQVPEEIPPVAALVTGQLQAPLAHVAVLSRNRNTPDMALRGAMDLHHFRGLEGELVRLSVASQDYSLVRAERRDMPVVLEATGTVSALTSVDVKPQMASVVTQVHVKEGQFVRRGDLLFTLDSRSDQANLGKAQAQLQKDLAALADAQRQFARSQELFAQKVAPRFRSGERSATAVA